MTRYREHTWYIFGLKLGILNLIRNKNRLGTKKTIGKIFQPINAYTRFPEYFFFWQQIDEYLSTIHSRARILDLGSPKLFGLYLAHHYNAWVHLTDISSINIDEYAILWQALKQGARGAVAFTRVDGRALPQADTSYDVVYAMSVLEHIEGHRQDTHTVHQLLRVLRPGGMLLLSVPFGNYYCEQLIIGMAHAAEMVRDRQRYFFQRIYNAETAQAHLLTPLLEDGGQLQLVTVFRAGGAWTRMYHQIRHLFGANINGLIGFTNPLASILINRHSIGAVSNIPSKYATIHTRKDIYGDLIIVYRKRSTDKEMISSA
ncbi:class I SAM-dependent methyltransferase [Kallotenue papyrolyticum]|uniref:class I SAM-dependent methyltransferase n=1 Tax=Kallotenue papyrolyticum TaxID=1325125 RepID=UPI000492AF56|nr:class I SAM-dependent methyltransferase [Kallotenue papyrolyticum]